MFTLEETFFSQTLANVCEQLQKLESRIKNTFLLGVFEALCERFRQTL